MKKSDPEIAVLQPWRRKHFKEINGEVEGERINEKLYSNRLNNKDGEMDFLTTAYIVADPVPHYLPKKPHISTTFLRAK